MARPRKFATYLSNEDKAYLESLVSDPEEKARHQQRARVMLLANSGLTNEAIAQQLGISAPTVVRVLKKWNAYGVKGALSDLQRSGKPPVISAQARAWVKAVAGTNPRDLEDGTAAGQWSIASLRKYLIAHCESAGYPDLLSLSTSTVWEILKQNDHRSLQNHTYPEVKAPELNVTPRKVPLLYQRLAWLMQFPGPQAQQEVENDHGIAQTNASPNGVSPCAQYSTGDATHSPKGANSPLKTISLLTGIDLLTGEVTALVSDAYNSEIFRDFLKCLDAKYSPEVKICVILDTHGVCYSAAVMNYLSLVHERFDFSLKPAHGNGAWLNLIESLFSRMLHQALSGFRADSLEALAKHINHWLTDINAVPRLFRWDTDPEDIWSKFT